MEQSIINAAIAIVEKDFPESEVYQQAALRIRLPYWDPFRPRAGEVEFPGIGGTTSFPYDFKLPRILAEENVMVLEEGDDTTLTKIPNPLYRFNFPSSDGLTTKDWSWLRSSTKQRVGRPVKNTMSCLITASSLIVGRLATPATAVSVTATLQLLMKISTRSEKAW
jgi:hypothetical protein